MDTQVAVMAAPRKVRPDIFVIYCILMPGMTLIFGTSPKCSDPDATHDLTPDELAQITQVVNDVTSAQQYRDQEFLNVESIIIGRPTIINRNPAEEVKNSIRVPGTIAAKVQEMLGRSVRLATCFSCR